MPNLSPGAGYGVTAKRPSGDVPTHGLHWVASVNWRNSPSRQTRYVLTGPARRTSTSWPSISAIGDGEADAAGSVDGAPTDGAGDSVGGGVDTGAEPHAASTMASVTIKDSARRPIDGNPELTITLTHGFGA